MLNTTYQHSWRVTTAPDWSQLAAGNLPEDECDMIADLLLRRGYQVYTACTESVAVVAALSRRWHVFIDDDADVVCEAVLVAGDLMRQFVLLKQGG